MNGQGIIYLALGVVIAGAILSSPIAEEQYTETYYTAEPYNYEQSLVHESQVRTGFLWLKHVTQVQYLITNKEYIQGKFTLSFVFDNGSQTGTVLKEVNISAGEQKAVTANSPLSGKSKYMLTITPPNKSVPHQRPMTKKITGWEALWRLTPFVK
ncbi:MAG: hypothetical protein ABR958_06440 [Dehalococcoidales bacterium]